MKVRTCRASAAATLHIHGMINQSHYDIDALWIPSYVGGRSGRPEVGLRPTIRLQRDVGRWLQSAWSAQIIAVAPTNDDGRFRISVELLPGAIVSVDGARVGDFVELMDGYRVIAVGRLVGVEL